MLDIEFICPGKTKRDWLRTAIDEYLKNLRPYAKIRFRILKESSSNHKDTVIQTESEKILQTIDPRLYAVLLDHTGESFSSETLAEFFGKNADRGIAKYQFIIGGAYGVNQEVKKAVKKKISLSPMTFTHQMIRLLAVEQIYRSCSIINRTGYHH